MDSLIKRFDCARDDDLMLCESRGIAYQRDMRARRVPYDNDYYDKVDAYENTEIARAVNHGRVALLARHVKPHARVLDYGAGTGAFLRTASAAGFYGNGFDVMLRAAQHLQDVGVYADDPSGFDAVTLWDTIEHLEDPELTLRAVRKGAHLFASIPVFDGLRRIRESKHYRPGEHLYYWTAAGFINYMALYGFRLIEQSAHESKAGRESIGAFAFCRDLPDYHDHVAAYQEIHSTRHYGSSAAELHLSEIADVVRTVKPMSILDYGCGRSDLAAYFWRDGHRRIGRYDPAIPSFKDMPEEQFDLVLCCDVMEHVPMASVDRVLAHIHTKSAAALFTISTKLSRAKLPDGRNAHVTLLNKSEWTRWIADVFGAAKALPSKWDHELVLMAGSCVSEQSALLHKSKATAALAA